MSITRAIEIPETANIPAIEYAITAGPGYLIDYGVMTEPMGFESKNISHIDEDHFVVGVNRERLHISPTTTSCMTGK